MNKEFYWVTRDYDYAQFSPADKQKTDKLSRLLEWWRHMSFNGARVYSHRKVEILSCAENKYDFALTSFFRIIRNRYF